MKTNNGKYLEQIVHLIEKSISPDAIVLHDVQMPILNSQIGATRQCDIVIKSGIFPRETITIVEVQDRNRSVELNDFSGWITKIKDIGAQHLICVSNHEFSATIKEQAELLGNKIRLMKIDTLKDIDGLPINLFDATFFFNLFNVVSYSFLRILANNNLINEKGIDTRQKIFSFDNVTLMSLDDICYKCYIPNEYETHGKCELIIKSDSNNKIFIHQQNEVKEIDLEVSFNWVIDRNRIPAKTFSYTQNQYGTLAWLIEASHPVNGKTIEIKIPVTKSEFGNSYQIISNQMYTNAPPDSTLLINVNKNN
ncbi:MAG TPA: hypothetical protein PK431_10000 [Chitinophagales bacterium]|nr:hypothetical protein [Chitinophagales bacterium]